MITKLEIFGIIWCALLAAAIFYVLFGQITVRKLRKNPETKDELGMDFVSGRDIINVAQALAIPAGIIRKLRTTKLAFLYADPDILIKHTTKFDRVLARIFYWTLLCSGFSMLIFSLVDIFVLKKQ